MNLIDNKIYLASKSPRRSELLQQIGVGFDLLLLRSASGRAVDVTEFVLPDEPAASYVARVTAEKASTAWRMSLLRNLPERPVLAADTTVVLHGRIYGKPGNRDEAYAMLSALSGQTHQVLTSIAVHYHDRHWQCTQISEVTFCPLNARQINDYCDSAEPYDKAGGYGIQGAAARFISHIAGSYSGIMGLPLFETAQLLSEVEL